MRGRAIEVGGNEIHNNAVERSLPSFVRTTYSLDQPVNYIEESMPRSLKAEAAVADPS
jgi:hypothetical protein